MYHSYTWKRKVLHMSDAQVYAIWRKLQDSQTKQPKEEHEADPEIPF